MIQENLKIPVGHREFKRVEFLEVYEKKFGIGYGTMNHEDATFKVAISSPVSMKY